MSMPSLLEQDIPLQVARAIAEDVGGGDITAQLIPEERQARARVITRDDAVLCGTAWVEEVFRQIDPSVKIIWQAEDGDRVIRNQVLFYLEGSARSLLTGERCALNFVQSLSGTATRCQEYADMVSDTKVQLLDTRKTIPGLRLAQKYAVTCGDCFNHRIGLYDAFLIKENHITACGSIKASVERAHEVAPGKPVEIEVENLYELEEALASGADVIMVDNFSLEMMREAVAIADGKAKLEASGGVTHKTLRDIALTGVDYISIGALTKDCNAVDLSMRLVEI